MEQRPRVAVGQGSLLQCSDHAIRQAQQLLWRDYRILSEPGGAAALGALISGRYTPQRGERVGVLLCGGNVDPTTL